MPSLAALCAAHPSAPSLSVASSSLTPQHGPNLIRKPSDRPAHCANWPRQPALVALAADWFQYAQIVKLIARKFALASTGADHAASDWPD